MHATRPRRPRSCRSACISPWCSSPASGCRRRLSPGSNTSPRSSADVNWSSRTVDANAWIGAGERLRTGQVSLVSLWGEPGMAHLALIDESCKVEVLHLPCADNHLPSIARLHAPAIRLERAMRDLCGLQAEVSPGA